MEGVSRLSYVRVGNEETDRVLIFLPTRMTLTGSVHFVVCGKTQGRKNNKKGKSLNRSIANCQSL